MVVLLLVQNKPAKINNQSINNSIMEENHSEKSSQNITCTPFILERMGSMGKKTIKNEW